MGKACDRDSCLRREPYFFKVILEGSREKLPVIAKRVIEESRGMLDLHRISTTSLKAASQQNKNVNSMAKAHIKSTESKPRPKPVDKKLKEARDYSFLLCGDAEFPAPAKDPIPRQKAHPTDARLNRVTANREPSASNPANMLRAIRYEADRALYSGLIIFDSMKSPIVM